MRKYPAEVSASETCIDANLKMVKSRDPDTFSISRNRNDALDFDPYCMLPGSLMIQKNVYLNNCSQNMFAKLG